MYFKVNSKKKYFNQIYFSSYILFELNMQWNLPSYLM